MRLAASRRATIDESLKFPIRTAASKPSSTRFTARSANDTSRPSWECAAAKSSKAGPISTAPNDTGTESRNSPRGPASPTEDWSWSNASRRSRARAR